MALVEREFLELSKELDVRAFWDENASCEAFSTGKARCAISFSPDDHWLFGFLDVESTLRYYSDKPYRDGLHREANRATVEHLGAAFSDEDTWENSPRRIENLFGSEFVYTEGGTPWLSHLDGDAEQFSRVLDRAEGLDLRSWCLPEAFLLEWEGRKAAGKPLPRLGTGSRGPATIMTSVLKPETVFYWMYDYPELMGRFRDILGAKMVELNRILRDFSGNSESGWWITDDNSALFNLELYREYCAPVLRTVLDAMAPAPSRRYQHSDSSMGHLLEEQSALGINSVNYGPEVDAGLIRRAMPDAVINGHMPPFLLRNGSPGEIRARTLSDFEKAGASGGLVVTTAGSLASGTGVGRMRYQMSLVDEICRYDRG
jgi:uroporphyrinogen decarboxylase